MTNLDHPSNDDDDHGVDMPGRTPTMAQEAAALLMDFMTGADSRHNSPSPGHSVSEINNSPVPHQQDQNKIHASFDKIVGTNCESKDKGELVGNIVRSGPRRVSMLPPQQQQQNEN